MGHADWAVKKIGGIGGIKAVISKDFGYGGLRVRGPLRAVGLEGFKENKYYDTLLDLIAQEKSL